MLFGDVMKVISIKEPWATLIKDNKKHIETRSWRTTYRGPIYIHASKSKVPSTVLNNVELMNIVGDSHMNYGKIICRANLIDCVYMTQEFINQMRQNEQEYICGFYEEGRYAWILSDVEELSEYIAANGHLGIWNYDDH